MTRLTRPARLFLVAALTALATGAGYGYAASVTGRLAASLQLTETSAASLAGVNATVTPSVALNLTYTSGTGAGQVDLKWCRTDSIPASGADTFDLRGTLTNEFAGTVAFAKVKAIGVEAYSTNTNDVWLGGKFPGHWDTFLKDSSTVSLPPGYALVAGGSGAGGWAVTANTADTLILRNSAAGTQVKYDICLTGTSS